MTERVEHIGGATLYLGDCRDILRGIEADGILTDPPYGLGELWTGGKNKWPLHHGEMAWDATIVEELPSLISRFRYQVVWGGHLYPLPVSRGWLIWDKLERNDSFTSGQAEMAWTNQARPIRVWRRCSTEVMSTGKVHPTQKPWQLMVWCLGFMQGAPIVCDPFMGSGTSGVACAMLGRHFIGIERHEPYFDIACRRIEQAYRQRDLFVDAPVPIDPSDVRCADLFAEPQQ